MSIEITKNIDQFKKNIANISTDGIVITLLLLMLLLVLIPNIVRAIERGFTNYSVYISERELLDREKARNEDLQEVLEYYQSPETKKILARDVLNLAPENELLYETRDEAQFYVEQIELLEVDDIGPYKSLWMEILPF